MEWLILKPMVCLKISKSYLKNPPEFLDLQGIYCSSEQNPTLPFSSFRRSETSSDY